MADAILNRAFPFPEPDTIVTIWETVPRVAAERHAVSPANYFDWLDQCHGFSQLAAYQPWEASVTGTTYLEPVEAYRVSPAFFSLLRVSAIGGYVLHEGDTAATHQIVVSHGFWAARMGSDPNFLGESVQLNGSAYTVVGVMPDQFDFPMYAEIWAPWNPPPDERKQRAQGSLGVLARLKPGISLSRAQAEMSTIAAGLALRYPAENAGRGVSVTLLRDSAVGPYARAFTALMTTAVTFLLLLACANVANLQLARGAARRKEMALRAALGASRSRLVGYLLTEGVLLSSMSAILGLPLAGAGVVLFRGSIPDLVSRRLRGLTNMQLDSHMLAWACAAALITGVAFSIPAALQIISGRLSAILNESGRGSAAPISRRIQSGLVVSEVVLAVVLLIGADLMVNGFHTLAALKAGFETRNVMVFTVHAPESRYRPDSEVVDFYQRALRSLGTIPDLQSVAAISELPALGLSRSVPVDIEGQGRSSNQQALFSEMRVVSEDCFRTLAIPISAGRSFGTQDRGGTLPVAVISKAAARRFWFGKDPLGHRFRIVSRQTNTPWLTIVGIAGDVNHFLLDREVRPTVYVPYTQHPIRTLSVVMKTVVPPSKETALAVRETMRAVDPAQPLYNLDNLGRVFSDVAGAVGAVAALLTALAVVALALSGAGIYAAIAYWVSRQAREIGIRMALGARPHDVRWMVVGKALRLIMIALAIGLPAALALGRVTSSRLSGVITLAPLQFVLCGMFMLAIAILASLVPANRAASVDPIVALRHD